jgi:hypothetical protein
MNDLNKNLEEAFGDAIVQPDSVQPEQTMQSEQPVQSEEAVQSEQPQEESVEFIEYNEPIQQTEEIQQSEATVENESQSSLQDDDVSEEEMDAAMLEYMSERLGREISSFDELQETQNTSTSIDKSLVSLNRFVQETGRGVEDWLAYQQLNTSEMDDLTAVRMQMKSQYGQNVSNDDLNLLIEDKYNLDEDIYDESEIKLAKLQLKLDADKARREIEDFRSKYEKPKSQVSAEPESLIDETWVNDMSAEVDALEGIEFQVSKDKSFTFGLEDSYKSELKSKNERIEDFFTPYVNEAGQWDFEKWNMHQAVLDNIETIVKSAYSQGLGDGQLGLVDKAANVQYTDPAQVAKGTAPNEGSVNEQLRQALGLNDNSLTFKI